MSISTILFSLVKIHYVDEFEGLMKGNGKNLGIIFYRTFSKNWWHHSEQDYQCSIRQFHVNRRVGKWLKWTEWGVKSNFLVFKMSCNWREGTLFLFGNCALIIYSNWIPFISNHTKIFGLITVWLQICGLKYLR